MPAPTSTESGLYATSAGLDLVSGVFGFLSSMAANDAAQSRAAMVRMEAEANAQRYGEQAAARIAQTSVSYLASGVTLQGSPIDTLDTQARLAKENQDSILMTGAVDALDTAQRGTAAEISGRNALVGSFAASSAALYKGFGFGTGFTPGNSAGGVSGAQMDAISRTS